MKRWILVMLLSGCLGNPSTPVVDDCTPMEHTLFFGPDHGLQTSLPPDGRTAGNGFDGAFLSNEMDEWTSAPFDAPALITGTLRLMFWTQGNNMPAPVVIGGDPGEGYHFFNQVGSERGFIESYAVEYASATPDEQIVSYEESYDMPEGGLRLEAGERIRLLLTNLVLEDAEGEGPDILWGITHPSAVRFTTECAPELVHQEVRAEDFSISIPGHHGLITGLVPAQEGVNHQSVPFTLDEETDRLTIRIAQTGGSNPLKDDIDLTVFNAQGDAVWGIGSPYTDEVGTKWRAGLNATMPPGDYVVRVDSYSGHGYEGRLTVLQERAWSA